MSKRTMIILCSIFAVILLAAALLPTLSGQEDPTEPHLATNPTDPQPTDPKPTDPKPTDPKPTEPATTEPAGPSTGLIIGIVAAVVVVCAVVAFVLIKKRKG